MDRVDVGDLGGADDPVGPQVAVGALRAPDADGLVGQLDVERLDVGLRIDRERLDAELAAGADDAEGDFAAVGDEDFLDHRVGNSPAPSRAGVGALGGVGWKSSLRSALLQLE